MAIGDEEILKYKFSEHQGPEYMRLKNYANNETSHKTRCDSCFSLSNQYLLLIYLNQSSEENINISMQATNSTRVRIIYRIC